MARKKRKVPQVNSTSTADIAFMMLLFFLLTSSMDTDRGLPRRLPQPVPKDQKAADVDIKKRNILVVLINSTNQILCGDSYIQLNQLKDKIKEFVENPTNNEHMPEKVEIDVPYYGNRMVTKNHVISLQNDRGTNYQSYIDVQNEIAAAYNELRDNISAQKFGKKFIDLDEEQQKAVQLIYPQKISEAEPKNYGGVK
ncbi:MAG: biopolymer transporter ExbD [Tannerellaceae bacterium]|jgi:biopolymer transport protein ExbD|nr:biopolymer transporter ExbD [Tannerellaceae bacterium]